MKNRIALITDVSKIVEVAEATWRQTYATIISQEQIDFMYEKMFTVEAIKQQMQDGVTFLMCIEDNKIRGFVAYQIIEDNIINIPKLYIKPDSQKRGIGEILLNDVISIALKNKIDFLELNVNRKNPAMYFYKKMGFELYEKTDIAYGKFWLNDYVLRKSLTNKN